MLQVNKAEIPAEPLSDRWLRCLLNELCFTHYSILVPLSQKKQKNGNENGFIWNPASKYCICEHREQKRSKQRAVQPDTRCRPSFGFFSKRDREFHFSGFSPNITVLLVFLFNLQSLTSYYSISDCVHDQKLFIHPFATHSLTILPNLPCQSCILFLSRALIHD